MKKLRLDRLLANLGYGSRKEVQAIVADELVSLDGEILRRADQHILLEPDLCERLLVSEEPLDPLPGILLVMNKPTGVACSHKDPGDVVYELLPERWRSRDPQITTIGRLDKDTSGLLLLTDDGALVHRISSPKKQIVKTYIATLARPLRGDEANIFASGTLLLESESNPLLPAKLVVHSPLSATVSIAEGRYHQVRRMFAAVGNHVESLERTSIGSFFLPPELAPGEYRVVSEQELAAIFETK